MNMEHKLALGVLLPSAGRRSAHRASTTSRPWSRSARGRVASSVAKPATGGTYFVEYRWPVGTFDSQAGVPAGALVTRSRPHGGSALAHDGYSTAPVDYPTSWVSGESVGERRDERGSDVHLRGQRHLDRRHGGRRRQPRLRRRPPSSTHAAAELPGGLSAVASGTSVSLSWTPAGDDFGVASYSVARDGATIGSTAATGFTDARLAPGATVAYAVTATDTAGNVGLPATVSVTLPDTVAPSAPADVTATVGRDGHGASPGQPRRTNRRGLVSRPAQRNGDRATGWHRLCRHDATSGRGRGRRVLGRGLRPGRQRRSAGHGQAAARRAAARAGRIASKASRAKGHTLVRVRGVLRTRGRPAACASAAARGTAARSGPAARSA